MKSFDNVKIIYNELIERKAENVVVLDINKVSSIADYFIIASADSERGVKSLVDFVSKKIKERFGNIGKIEGVSGGRWIVIDFGDVIVHVFHKDTREYFNLESLWDDAKVVGL
ncbi:MAG: ribosome silencing factor [Thermodesulfobacteriota bacterium]|nr:ribosome silencing factor [Thermodesulfobacteriota bacterium]